MICCIELSFTETLILWVNKMDQTDKWIIFLPLNV